MDTFHYSTKYHQYITQPEIHSTILPSITNISHTARETFHFSTKCHQYITQSQGYIPLLYQVSPIYHTQPGIHSTILPSVTNISHRARDTFHYSTKYHQYITHSQGYIPLFYQVSPIYHTQPGIHSTILPSIPNISHTAR